MEVNKIIDIHTDKETYCVISVGELERLLDKAKKHSIDIYGKVNPICNDVIEFEQHLDCEGNIQLWIKRE